MSDECLFCSGKVNDDPVSENGHQWKDLKHIEDFKIYKLPRVDYYSLRMRSTVIIENEIDYANIWITLNYCHVCGRRLTKDGI